MNISEYTYERKTKNNLLKTTVKRYKNVYKGVKKMFKKAKIG